MSTPEISTWKLLHFVSKFYWSCFLHILIYRTDSFCQRACSGSCWPFYWRKPGTVSLRCWNTQIYPIRKGRCLMWRQRFCCAIVYCGLDHCLRSNLRCRVDLNNLLRYWNVFHLMRILLRDVQKLQQQQDPWKKLFKRLSYEKFELIIVPNKVFRIF